MMHGPVNGGWTRLSDTGWSTHEPENSYLDETETVLRQVDRQQVREVTNLLRDIRANNGRLFLCGNGGGAGHASHACNDFRKIANIEAYCVNDNVSELTARINDNGWATCYRDWLRVSKLSINDCLFVLSVGGGSLFQTSTNIFYAIDEAVREQSSITGIQGNNETSYLRERATKLVTIPTNSTPIVEGLQAVIWHGICMDLA